MKTAMLVTMVGLACGAAGVQAADDSLLWIEGESAARSKTHRNAWFDAVDPQELSGGGQIANFSEPDMPEGWAEYDVQLPAAGAWQLWLRANPCTGLLYRVDDGSWVTLDPKALQEEDKQNRRTKGYVPKVRQWFNVAADGQHDARTMTWLLLGALDLAQGKHTLRFSLGGQQAGEKRFAALDCFVLTTGQFEPNFQYKPGEKPQDLVRCNEAESWPFDPPTDEFSADALVDLRGLNEQFAGQHGFIRLSEDGNDFVRGDGQPIRFWGGSTYVQREANQKKDQKVLEYHARFLAKRGVNVVRLHGSIDPKGEDSKVTDVDEKELDEIFRLVAAMKMAGVYTIISPYWGSHTNLQTSWGVADPGSKSCAALVFFDPVLQQGYKAWLKRIYHDVNPYTSKRLADDPAVAIIQIQNEDSMLFWTMQGVKGQALQNLRQHFGDWVLKKYGSFDKAKEAWKGYPHEEDDFAHGRPGMFIVWEFTQQAREKRSRDPQREPRLSDQLEFMARVMFDFNREIGRYLREELGCKHLINAGNWRTVDQVYVDDAERWSYTANEVLGKNHYFGGLHNGLNVGWQILPGQVFTSRSFTKDPIGSPLGIRQVVGRPFIVPESLWVPPTRYQSEAPLIVAAQSCLTGLDTFYWFATGAPDWQPPMNKWTFATPVTQGQFPAAALIFRQGYVKPGPAVVHEERSLQNIWDRTRPLIAEEGAWDPNRDTGDMPPASPYKTGVDPLAFLVGRVEVAYGGDPAKSKVIDLAPYIDRQQQLVRSVTGEIETDLARGVYRVNTPRAQAAAGFLGKAGPQKLADVTIDCQNEYASVVVVPLDDRPIAESRKLLVQVGTVCRPTGWTERPLRIRREDETIDAARIITVGGSPWQVENTQATITVRNPALSKATLLDPNGLPLASVPVVRDGQSLQVVLPSHELYVCLQ